ncbi:hypothetical protein TRAPUB_9375, partial [Trametes pubescens]
IRIYDTRLTAGYRRIAIIIGLAVVACLCGIGLWQWCRRRASRSASGPESWHGTAANASTGVVTREVRTASELGEGSAEASSGLPAGFSGSPGIRSSSRTAFSAERLVLHTETQPEVEGLEAIDEVER